MVTPKFVKTSENSYWNNDMPLPKVEASPLAISRAIKGSPWSLVDMFEDSPHRPWGCKPAEIICSSTLRIGLLWFGKEVYGITCKEWLNITDIGDQIVPNPSRVNVGINMKGNPSQHCRDATGRRKYIVVESDDESLSFDEKRVSLGTCVMRLGRN